MKDDDPRHGSYAGALQHWRESERTCDACRSAANRARKARDLDRIAGRPRIVELGGRAHHILTTQPRVQLEKATGIRRPKLMLYTNGGPECRVHRSTRDRILAAGGGWTVVGITRRVQALSALGWSLAALSDEMGLSKDSLGRARNGHRTFIRHSFAETIVEHYGQLQAQRAPRHRGSIRVIADARRNQWAPPMAWDNIDDPNEKPSGIASTKPRKNQRKADVLAEVQHLMSLGESIEQVAKALGLTPESLADYAREQNEEAA